MISSAVAMVADVLMVVFMVSRIRALYSKQALLLENLNYPAWVGRESFREGNAPRRLRA